ncbi:MAG: hypothetical protein JXD18_08470 [Anaerolineae bacterium]|nr:hypothetical protein [Anaerolineae bacterium]
MGTSQADRIANRLERVRKRKRVQEGFASSVEAVTVRVVPDAENKKPRKPKKLDTNSHE